VSQVVDHTHYLAWLDRLGQMHLIPGSQCPRALFITRVRCNRSGWN